MTVREVACKPRKCGRRRPGGVYLVSEPGRGILPLITKIDPPIPYPGEQFRGTISVYLDLLLIEKPVEEYMAGASAERLRKEIVHAPDIASFGMPLRTRQSIGLCRLNGVEALADLYPSDIGNLGLAIRALSRIPLGKVSVEVPIAFRHIQDREYSLVLAALWRLWNRCPKQQKPIAKPHVRLAMMSLGAELDALEI